jgi:hypothetical protein
MRGEFYEKFKVDIALFDTTGSTTEQVSKYYDMLDYRSIGALAVSRSLPTTGSTTIQKTVVRLLQASNSTGGGATAVSSANATIGQSATFAVSAADKANSIYVQFTTLASGATFSVGGYQWSFDSTAVAASRVMNSTGATGQASVAAELFVTSFNNTANNPIATAWEAATVSSALVNIRPLTGYEQATYITATGSTLVMVRVGRSAAYVGLEAQYMGDGKRYVAVGVTNSDTAAPVTVTIFREANNSPVNQLGIHTVKTINQSTSK